MKKVVLALCLMGSSAFAGNSQIGSSETQACDGNDMEVRMCLHERAMTQAKILTGNIEKKKQSVKEIMESENIDSSMIKKTIDDLDKVPKQIQEAVAAYCAAEGAEETSIGSIGRLVSAGCVQEKMKALKEIFK